jgi:hypothetical protein
MEDFLRPLADDVVVALDAATGKTLWKTTTPTASVNHQTHKWRGFNPSPFVDVACGTVYLLNYSNRVYALDAKTGAVKWRYDGAASKSFAASGAGAIAVGNVVALPAGENLIGLDAASGKELWKQPGGNARPWSAGAQTYFLTTRTVHLNEKDEKGKNKTVYRVTCHDPATGKAVWKDDIDSRASDYLPIVAGDMLLTYNAVIEQNVADSGRVLAYKLAEDGIKKAWDVAAPAPVTDSFGMSVGNDVLYVDGDKRVFAYRLSDGRKLAAVENVGGARTQLAFFADGRLFIEPEGRHGRQSFWMLDGDPKNFRALGDEWLPPAPWTTAYADMPIAYPLVDGRLFVRGFDGIYCYDLRK